MNLIKSRVCLLLILFTILIIILRQTPYEKFTDINNNKVLWVIAHSDNYIERAKMLEKHRRNLILYKFYLRIMIWKNVINLKLRTI